MTELRRGFAFAALGAVLVVSPSRLAAAERVALVERGGSCALSEELLTQLRAELEAAGFDVVESLPVPAETAAPPDAFARVSCEPWERASLAISMGTADAPERRVLRADEDESTHSLVLRVTEFLRARVVEVTAPSRPELRVKEPPAFVEEPASLVYSAELGASALFHPGGLPFSVAPAVVLGVRVAAPLWIDVRAAGPFLGTERGGVGNAHVDQGLALVGVRYVALDGSVDVFASAAVGAFRLGAHGDATPPFRSLTDSALSAAFAVGAGASVGVTRAGGVALELGARADALLLTPQPTLRLAETAVAKAGQPACGLTATIGARW